MVTQGKHRQSEWVPCITGTGWHSQGFVLYNSHEALPQVSGTAWYCLPGPYVSALSGIMDRVIQHGGWGQHLGALLCGVEERATG